MRRLPTPGRRSLFLPVSLVPVLSTRHGSGIAMAIVAIPVRGSAKFLALD